MASRRPGLFWFVMGFFADLNADDRSLQRNSFDFEIDVVAAFTDALLRSLFRAFRAVDIDFVGSLCGFGKHADRVGQHFPKSPGYGEPIPPGALPVSQH